ncbi:MAG: hypothetical protein JWN70_6026 [Planctomycetaceae bacterium]|nr:hypothetical protein [Planctomycetaceae bacterium]
MADAGSVGHGVGYGLLRRDFFELFEFFELFTHQKSVGPGAVRPRTGIGVEIGPGPYGTRLTSSIFYWRDFFDPFDFFDPVDFFELFDCPKSQVPPWPTLLASADTDAGSVGHGSRDHRNSATRPL